MLKQAAKPEFTSFVDYLLNENDIDEGNAERLRKARRSTSQASDIIATELGILSDEHFARRLARFCNAQLLSIDAIIPNNDGIQQLFPDVEILKVKAVIPISMEDAVLRLVVADPFDDEFLVALGFQTACRVETDIATRADILERLQELEGGETELSRNTLDGSFEAEQTDLVSQGDLDRLNSLAMDAPTVRAVQEIVQFAVLSDSTDIHIEPEEHFLTVRLRIDGILMPHTQLSMDMHSGFVSRIKILSRLNIAERRLPQDGRMRMTIRGIDVDFRVSIVPTMKGEMIVLRVLNRERVKLDFEELGFDRQDIRKIEKLLTNSHGILLVTGPTNSGKSTSLYTALSTFEASKQKIITVEDPVELQLDGINQIQVQPEVGLDFPTALRSVLRQDPDILMIGEIRDAETAQIAIRAAITGHLVLATLHTNSAAGAITRLRDIGIEDYLIAATVRGVISQRLLRTLCPQCSNHKKSNNQECSNCNNTGYSGRTVVCEILVCDDGTAELINKQALEDRIYSHSTKNGMRTMSECAMDLVKAGRTSKEEIARVTSLSL